MSRRILLIILALIPQIIVAQNAPVAHFVAANNAICDSTYSEAFSDQSTNNPTSWKWYFPGATPDTSTLKNPTNITYKGYGCYTVKLVVKNKYGSDSLTDSNYICLDSPPHITLTGNFKACIQAQKKDTITAHGGTHYLWMNGDTTPSIVFVDGGGPILYFKVTVYNGACSKDSTFYIVSDSMPLFVFRGDTSICVGNSTTIYAFNPRSYKFKYLWSTGSTTDSIIVNGIKAGTYTYKLTVTKGGCIDSSKIKIGVHDCTGVENYHDPALSIGAFPNPSNGVFTLQANSQQLMANSHTEIFNVLGEKVYSNYQITKSNYPIDLSNQPNGVYMYRVISQNGDLVEEGKIVIER